MPSEQPDPREARTVRAVHAWLLAAAVVAFVLIADQVTKSAVRHGIVPGEEHRFLPGVELVNTRNHGVAFGFLPGSHVGVTILIAIALLVLLVYFAMHVSRPLIWLPTGMLIGGAVGNIVDRIRSGSVTDFVKLPLGWPPFNLADASITLGVIALFLVIDRDRAAARRREAGEEKGAGAGVPNRGPLESGGSESGAGVPTRGPLEGGEPEADGGASAAPGTGR